MQQSHPLYDADSRRWLKRLAVVLALLALAAELFVHLHGYFPFAEIFGFYALGGLIATVTITGIALLLRGLLSRREDYYDH